MLQHQYACLQENDSPSITASDLLLWAWEQIMRIMGHGSSGGGGRGQNKWPRGTPLERAHKAQCTLSWPLWVFGRSKWIVTNFRNYTSSHSYSIYPLWLIRSMAINLGRVLESLGILLIYTVWVQAGHLQFLKIPQVILIAHDHWFR